MRLIESAVKLTHRHGFRTTSIVDIAQEADVPVGNVYYYFKTKHDIGEAVIQRRTQEFYKLRQQCEKAPSPKERLVAFVQHTFANRYALVRNGCPFGTLYSELHKEGGALANKADALFSEPLAWLEDQFGAAGHGQCSRELAVHLFSALQGVAVLAHGSRDPGLIVMETARLTHWIRSLREVEDAD
jgi:TetR/AcrR family transcriptional regulator, transcriptional repressor for nem operon